MSTKTEKVWIVMTPKGHIVGGKFWKRRDTAMRDVVGQRREGPWKLLYHDGYRCVRATLTYEVPDE